MDPRLSQCGIAKLLGARGEEVLEFFMRKYTIVLGRNSKNCQVDLVLGDSMSISRKHASITYNFEARRFELHVMGKNGVNKDGELVTPEKAPVSLHSGDRIRTGDCDFYFLLPSGGPVVAAAVQPPRNGIGATAQEPLPQAVSPAANVDMHTASMRSDLSAAVLQGAADPIQGPTGAHVHIVGQEGSSPMDVDGGAAAAPFRHTTAAAQPIIGQGGYQGADQAAVTHAVVAYHAAQGNSGQGGEEPPAPMFSQLANALSAMPPQLPDRLPPQ